MKILSMLNENLLKLSNSFYDENLPIRNPYLRDRFKALKYCCLTEERDWMDESEAQKLRYWGR